MSRMEPSRKNPDPDGGEASPSGRGSDEVVDRKLLILVVEDDEALRTVLCELLEDHGFRAVPAANGLHALAQLQTLERPDLIILDLMMPVMNGWDFHAHLQANPNLQTVPVLLLSAYVRKGTHTGPQDVAGALQKPVSLEELLGWVRRLAVRIHR
ncbi:MAG TPA: response regulator [Thermoanaerobaculia bacterium]